MAVVNVEELFEGMKGCGASQTNDFEYYRYFLVQVDDPHNGAYVVCNAEGLPAINDPYYNQNQLGGNPGDFDLEEDDFALLVDKYADRKDKDDWQFWIVTCKYSTEAKSLGDKRQRKLQQLARNDPTFTPPEPQWDSEIIKVARVEDRNNKPYLNSAQVPWKPTPTKDESRDILHITRYYSNWTRTDQTNWKFKVNARPFLGAKRGNVRCNPPRPTLLYKGDVSYFKVVFTLVFHEDPFINVLVEGIEDLEGAVLVTSSPETTVTEGGQQIVRPGKKRLIKRLEQDWWQPNILDEGYMELKPTGIGFEKLIGATPIMKGIHPVPHPKLLDGKGAELKTERGKTPVPVYIQFYEYEYTDFNVLISDLPKGLLDI